MLLNHQNQKLSLRILLKICLTFVHFEPRVAYKSVAIGFKFNLPTLYMRTEGIEGNKLGKNKNKRLLKKAC